MFSPYIQIKWQDGVVSEHGVNGAQLVDVIDVLIERLEELEYRSPCEENERTGEHLWMARDWQDLRTRRRQAQGVEGTEQAHVS